MTTKSISIYPTPITYKGKLPAAPSCHPESPQRLSPCHSDEAKSFLPVILSRRAHPLPCHSEQACRPSPCHSEEAKPTKNLGGGPAPSGEEINAKPGKLPLRALRNAGGGTLERRRPAAYGCLSPVMMACVITSLILSWPPCLRKISSGRSLISDSRQLVPTSQQVVTKCLIPAIKSREDLR